MAGQVFHAPVIVAVSGFRLVKVLERRSQTSRQRYPGVKVERDAAALIENASYFDLARKHVVDKPFTVTIVKPEEARNTIRMIELAMQSNAEKRTTAVS